MIIKEIDGNTFNEFANSHILKSFYQTKEYGELMEHSEFSTMYIGAYEDDVMVAGSLILYKTIGPSMKYGYAPRGFLVDYYNHEQLAKFTKAVKDYFFKKGYAFIKINPEITYSTIDFDSKSKVINTRNKELIDELKSLGYDKLKDNLYFESLLPKYTPVIYLPTYDFDLLDKSIIENAKDAELGGLRLIHGKIEDIPTLYSFVEDKNNKTEAYYRLFYEIFSKSDMVDLILVELNYDNYVKYLQKQYIYEQERNDKINRDFEENPKNIDLYNQKMKSDQLVAKISSQIAISNTKMQENHTKEIMGAAFVIKHEGRVTIYITGNKEDFAEIDVKTFMFYKIIESYKNANYLFLDLYGITADFTDTIPYKELK